MKDIAIYGAGGFGREVACIIDAINKEKPTWNLIGFFDDGLKVCKTNSYGKVLGGIDELNDYNKTLSVVIAIGFPLANKKVVDQITNAYIEFPNIIAPDVSFYDVASFSIGKGNIIGFKSIISCNVTLGDFNILNTDVILGHDVKTGSHNVMNPSTRISGEVLIGGSNFFGVGSIVLQQKRIGDFVIVGANSTIVGKVKNNCTYIGNPATEFKF